MPDIVTLAAIAAGLAVVLGLALVAIRPAARPVAFASAREERLTRQLAETVGCDLADALPSVREELRLAPGQSDETLLKRAAYHYRRELPDGPCAVWRDRAPG